MHIKIDKHSEEIEKPVIISKTGDSYKISWDKYWLITTEEDIADYKTNKKYIRLGGIYDLFMSYLMEYIKEAE